MQVYANRFQQHLQSKGLAKIHLIFGDEPLQKMEALQGIRDLAREMSIEERTTFVADSQFNWQTLLDECNAMSLFASTKLIEVEIPTGKPGKEGAKLLQDLASQPMEDIYLVFHGGKIGKDVHNTKWFKTLESEGVFVPIYDLEGNHLQQWLNARAGQHKLNLTQDAQSALLAFCEGNLLAASQELEKLSLLFGQDPVDEAQLQQSLVDHSQFDMFQLAELLLLGNTNKSLRVLHRLQSEGVEAVAILWCIHREMDLLIELLFAQKQGLIAKAWNELRIWKARQAGYLAAMRRLSQHQIEDMLIRTANLDHKIKSGRPVDAYTELQHLCLQFTHYNELDSFKISCR